MIANMIAAIPITQVIVLPKDFARKALPKLR
jgi:hypothetical protein